MQSRAIGIGLALVSLNGACGDNACPLPEDLGVQGRITVAQTPAAKASESTTVASHGVGDLGPIALDHGTGTLTVRGSQLEGVVIMQDTEWPSPGDTLVGVLAVSTTEIDLVWFYCRDGSVYHVYYEGDDGVLFGDLDATGSCLTDDSTAPSTTDLPAVDFAFPKLDGGFQIAGKGLHFDGVNPGDITLGDAQLVLLPFAHVDCTGCPGGGDGGWRELHALLWDAVNSDVSLAFFYFFKPGEVDLTYPVRVLPTWDDADGAQYKADWRSCDN
jgi:hypothetical protein